MLSIGGSNFISSEKIICIIDYVEKNNEINSLIYENFLEKNMVIDVTQGSKPKSIIITEKILYLSAISPITLQKRLESYIKVEGE